MKLFVVFKRGVYRHECGGVFSTLELAEKAATALLLGERDTHHDYEVVAFELDVVSPQSPKSNPGELFGKPHFWSGGHVDEPPVVLTLERSMDGVEVTRH